MTQIVTISATTAGYVMDALRPASRIARSAKKVDSDPSVQKLAPDATGAAASWSTAAPSPAISLFFMTADFSEQGQTTQAEVESAYREQTDGTLPAAPIVDAAVADLETIEG
jgi:hypothetical protein